MTLQDAINAMEEESTCLSVLTGCQQYFDKIEGISQALSSGIADNPAILRELLSESTSIYLALRPLLALADTEKKNREVVYYNAGKIDVEAKGGKFVSTAMEKEASAHVSTYRRVRNILDGYVDSLKTVISTCQSALKSIGEENRISLPQQQQV